MTRLRRLIRNSLDCASRARIAGIICSSSSTASPAKVRWPAETVTRWALRHLQIKIPQPFEQLRALLKRLQEHCAPAESAGSACNNNLDSNALISAGRVFSSRENSVRTVGVGARYMREPSIERIQTVIGFGRANRQQFNGFFPTKQALLQQKHRNSVLRLGTGGNRHAFRPSRRRRGSGRRGLKGFSRSSGSHEAPEKSAEFDTVRLIANQPASLYDRPSRLGKQSGRAAVDIDDQVGAEVRVLEGCYLAAPRITTRIGSIRRPHRSGSGGSNGCVRGSTSSLRATRSSRSLTKAALVTERAKRCETDFSRRQMVTDHDPRKVRRLRPVRAPAIAWPDGAMPGNPPARSFESRAQVALLA